MAGIKAAGSKLLLVIIASFPTRSSPISRQSLDTLSVHFNLTLTKITPTEAVITVMLYISVFAVPTDCGIRGRGVNWGCDGN